MDQSTAINELVEAAQEVLATLSGVINDDTIAGENTRRLQRALVNIMEVGLGGESVDG